MPANNANPRIALKLGLGVALVAAAAAAVFFLTREDATYVAVYRGNAADAVPGSVVVHADGDLKQLTSEVGGRVVSCDGLNLIKPFKKGDVLVQLDPTEQQRAIDQMVRDEAAAEQRLGIAYADNPEWLAARRKLNEAWRAQKPGEPASEELSRRQAEFDEIARQTDPRWIAANENLKNAERLHERGDISDVEWKRQQKSLADLDRDLRLGAFDAAKARADQLITLVRARSQLEKMKIIAPEDGTAAAVMVWPGALINGGATLATFYSTSRLVVAKVSEEDFSRIKIGQEAKVSLVIYGSQHFDATVLKILPTADPDTQLYTVYLDVAVDPAKLIPFSTGQATITVGVHPNVLLIPRRAVFEGNNVYVVRNGRVTRRTVKLGYTSLTTVEVAEGLAEGEQVISENVRQFYDGQHVRASALK